MTAAVAVLESGRPLTFKEVAAESGVPERTVYRYFPTRHDLLTALFDWANRRIGYSGERPTDRLGAEALVRSAFPAFDEMSAVVDELLASPEGRRVRLRDKADRQESAIRLVRREVPTLDPTSRTRIAAVVQVLMSAGTWQALRDHWDLDGAEAAEAVALAIDVLLDGASAPSDEPEETR
jgi:AcrR family transcriptional regulator